MERNETGGTAKRQNGGIGGSARALEHDAAEQLDELRERLGEVNERVIGFIRERPGSAIVIALGLGFLIGRVLRS